MQPVHAPSPPCQDRALSPLSPIPVLARRTGIWRPLFKPALIMFLTGCGRVIRSPDPPRLRDPMRDITLSATDLLKDHENPFVRFEPGDGGTGLLWVVASHVNIPPGKFAQSHVFERVPGAKLFLNCARNGWYQNGVGRRLATVRELVAAIGTFTEGFGQTNFVGHSMGAYLTLILAHEFDRGGQFLATSPEPVLLGPASRSRDNHVAPRFGWRDLTRRYAGRRPKCPGVTLFGACDPVDAGVLAGAGATCGLYGEVYAAPHHHGVTEYLTRHRRYLDLLADPVTGAASLGDSGIIGRMDEFGSPAQFARFNRTFRRFRAGQLAEAAKLLQQDPAWENAGWQALAAGIHRRRGSKAAAVEASRKAHRASPEMPLYIKEYALALIASGESAALRKLHRRLTRPKRRHPAVNITIRDIERSGLLERQPTDRQVRPPGDRPTWLKDLASFEAECLRRTEAGRVLPFAREVARALPFDPDDPVLLHRMIEILTRAGLRRTALICLERSEAPGARGLLQRIRLMLPDPVERQIDGHFH